MDELIRELKREGVLTSRYVEAAFRAIDRADFVPPEHRAEAYQDYPLPIGHGQTISQPYTVAFMLELLDPRPGEKILDVGAGSGWQSALLAHIVGGRGEAEGKRGTAGKVQAIERIPELCRFAKANIEQYGFLKSGAVEFHCGDATGGLPEGAPFDKIIAAAAGGGIPPAWREQLNVGGAIVAPVASSVWRYVKRSGGAWDEEEFPGFAFVPLVGGKPGGRARESGGKTRKPFPALALLLAAVPLALGTGVTFAPKSLPAEARRVEIAPGTGSHAIGALLKRRGVVRSAWAFVTYAALTGQAATLKPGAYEFGERAAIPEIVRMLERGELYPNERSITIPEGWDLRDIGTYLEQNGIASRRDLYAVTGEPARRYGPRERFPPPDSTGPLSPAIAAKPPPDILEGYLYPDTYRVFRDASARDIVQRMLENFERKLTPELRGEIGRRGKSIGEVITIASLLEKEVADPEDRRIVAGILEGRLASGMPLQVDATVNYITGKHETPSAADLAVDSPYNTYRYPGLPPTPISNPGLGAIRAAISPRPSDYRYYLSPPDGRTIFSRTLPEHVQAKARYLKR